MPKTVIEQLTLEFEGIAKRKENTKQLEIQMSQEISAVVHALNNAKDENTRQFYRGKYEAWRHARNMMVDLDLLKGDL